MDLALIDRALKGDTEAFSELVEKYQRPIYFTVLRMLSDHEEAADIAQQTFMNAFRSLADFRRDASFKTWLYQIAINLVRNKIKEKMRQPEFEDVEEMDIIADQKMPFDQLDDENRSSRMNAAIQTLPKQQRMTVILRVYEERSYEEIAKILGCAQETARAHFHLGIRALRKVLKGEALL
ncbi:MAG: sigma-70 family RNA polymerase sigma factor [Nitrospirota bacterium]